jgi:excisionase family DNA binding protein
MAVSDDDALIAKAAVAKLRPVAEAGRDIRMVVQEQADIIVPLPAVAVAQMLRILEAMSEQTPVSIIPYDARLTTQQAADYLNVSRQYFVDRLEAGDLSFERVGSHRRIRFGDLLQYEAGLNEKSDAALKEMARIAQECDLE